MIEVVLRARGAWDALVASYLPPAEPATPSTSSPPSAPAIPAKGAG